MILNKYPCNFITLPLNCSSNESRKKWKVIIITVIVDTVFNRTGEKKSKSKFSRRFNAIKCTFEVIKNEEEKKVFERDSPIAVATPHTLMSGFKNLNGDSCRLLFFTSILPTHNWSKFCTLFLHFHTFNIFFSLSNAELQIMQLLINLFRFHSTITVIFHNFMCEWEANH